MPNLKSESESASTSPENPSEPTSKIRSRKKLTLIVFLLLAVVGAPLAYLRFSPKARKARQIERANRYFEAADYDKARLEYLSLLKADPQNAIAIRNLGIIWSEQGAPFEAVPFLLHTRNSEPEDMAVRKRLALAFAAAGFPGDARKEVISILEGNPNDPEILVLLAETMLTAEDLKFTEDYLEKMKDKASIGYHLIQASLAHQKGDLAAAEAALKKAISADSKSPAPHAALGQVYRQQREVAKAEEAFKQASALAPLRSINRLRFADFKLRAGALDEAEVLVKEVTGKIPDYIPAWILQAEIAMARQKFDDSMKLLENVFARAPLNREGRLVVAQIDIARGNSAKAVPALEQLCREFPNSIVARFQLGRAYRQVGNSAQAAAILTQVVAVHPNNLEAILLLAEVNLALGNSKVVVTSMEAVLKKIPVLGQAQIYLAEAYRHEGRLDDAANIFRAQIQAEPKNPTSNFLLGLILRQQKKLPEARKAFELSEEQGPENHLPTAQLIDLDLAEKKYPEALARAERLQKRIPKSALPHLLIGRVHMAQQAWDKAEPALLKALEIDPDSAGGYDLLVEVYLRNKKGNEALARLEERVSKTPKDSRSRMLLALLYEQRKEYPKAQAAYEAVLAAKPDFVAVMNNLAYLYSEHLNMVDKASEMAVRARAAQPKDPKIADTLGWILFRKGDYSTALPLLEEAAQNLPEYQEVLFHVAMARYMMGQFNEARTALKSLATSTASFPGKNDVADRLKLIGNEAGQIPQFSRPEIEALATKFPNDPIVQLRLGETLERDGASDPAATAYETATNLNPRLVPALVKVAQLSVSKNPAKALEIAKNTRNFAPSDPEVALALANVAFAAQDSSWSYTILQSIGKDERNNPKVMQALAWVGYSLGKVTEAREQMEQVLKLTPPPELAEDAKKFLSATAWLQDPAALLAAGPEVEKLLAKEPDFVPALMAQGAIQTQKKETPAALKTYQKVLSKFPAFLPAKAELAALYVEQPDTVNQAFDLAKDVSIVQPENARAARVLGDVSFSRGVAAPYHRVLRLQNPIPVGRVLHA